MVHTLGLMSQKNLVPQRAGWSGAISCFMPTLQTSLAMTGPPAGNREFPEGRRQGAASSPWYRLALVKPE